MNVKQNRRTTRRTTRRATRATALVALPLVTALALAGCGNDDDTGTGDHAGMSGHMSGHVSGSPSGSSASHNDQDVSFVEEMIPHHRQAVVMSRLAQDRAGSPQVRRLAQRIEAAQGPEIKTMSGWLDDWGVDGQGMGGMQGMDGTGHMDSGDMPGMMSGREMAGLHHARGQQFDRLFLEGMIGHHRGAVQMADDEIRDGRAADVIDLARSIKASQTKEIAEMQQMLQQMSGA